MPIWGCHKEEQPGLIETLISGLIQLACLVCGSPLGTRRILVTGGHGKFLFRAGRKPDVEYVTDSVDPGSHEDGSLQMCGLMKAN